MTTFCVIHKDDGQDDLVYGPFTTEHDAQVFAADLIDRCRDKADVALFVDAATDGSYVCLNTEDDDTVSEAIVQKLMQP